MNHRWIKPGARAPLTEISDKDFCLSRVFLLLLVVVKEDKIELLLSHLSLQCNL